MAWCVLSSQGAFLFNVFDSFPLLGYIPCLEKAAYKVEYITNETRIFGKFDVSFVTEKLLGVDAANIVLCSS